MTAWRKATRYLHAWQCVRAEPLHHRPCRPTRCAANPPPCMKETR